MEYNVSKDGDGRCTLVMEVTRFVGGTAPSYNSFYVTAAVSSWIFFRINQKLLGMKNNAKQEIRLGILDRTGSRKFSGINCALIQDSAYLSTNLIQISKGTMNNKAVHEQAQWMRSMDVVLTPHGAQAANSFFLRQCAVLVEFFPSGYYIPGFYQPLGSEVGALAFAVSNGSTSPPIPSTYEGRSKVRALNVDVGSDFEFCFCCFMLPKILKSRSACLREAINSTIHPVFDNGDAQRLRSTLSLLRFLHLKCTSSTDRFGCNSL